MLSPIQTNIAMTSPANRPPCPPHLSRKRRQEEARSKNRSYEGLAQSNKYASVFSGLTTVLRRRYGGNGRNCRLVFILNYCLLRLVALNIFRAILEHNLPFRTQGAHQDEGSETPKEPKRPTQLEPCSTSDASLSHSVSLSVSAQALARTLSLTSPFPPYSLFHSALLHLTQLPIDRSPAHPSVVHQTRKTWVRTKNTYDVQNVNCSLPPPAPTRPELRMVCFD